MDDHLSHLARIAVDALAGSIAGAICGAAILWFDLFGLGRLIAGDQLPIVGAGMLIVGVALVFGGCAAATGIMLRYRDEA